MIKVICINGYPGVGKTTFENYCIDYLGIWGQKCSTIDFVKYIARECGWDNKKTPETRAFLSDLKDLLSNAPWGDVPLMKVKEFCNECEGLLRAQDVADLKTYYVFVDAREPKNIQKLKDELNAITVFIARECLEELSNHADRNVENFNYDYTITNDGSLDDLKEKAKDFVNLIKEEKKWVRE